MKTTPLKTESPIVNLVVPNVERDSQLGVKWLNSKNGRETLRLMGVPEADNKPTTLEQERQRVTEFIHNTSQWNWMIEYQSQVVGSIWVDLVASEYLPIPAVHIMVGDPTMRGKRIGYLSMNSVVKHLRHQNFNLIFSRSLTTNLASLKLLKTTGFEYFGDPYTDNDGLCWQNFAIQVTT